MSKAQRIVADLFALLHREPDLLPPEWQEGCDGAGGLKTLTAGFAISSPA